jgi:sialate O-acetylesterase
MDSLKVKEVLAKKRLESRQKPIGGVGPGIYFARNIFEQTGKKVALIPCGIGGTTMEQWSPKRVPGGDSSLYGAMINRIKASGGKLKGVIWFQGESEAMSGKTETYENDLLYLIDRIRADTGYKELPVIVVQIGCFNIHNPAMDKGYESVRDIQRNIYKKRSNLSVVSCLDLPLDDWAHISTEGQKRLGKRISEIALTEVYNKKGHAGQIDLESIKMCKDSINGSNYLLVHFSGICEKLQCAGKPGTFELRVNGSATYEFVVAKAIPDQDDPAGIRLYLSGVPVNNAQLVFGPGTNPYVNLTDNFDNGIPAFGPVDIPLK